MKKSTAPPPPEVEVTYVPPHASKHPSKAPPAHDEPAPEPVAAAAAPAAPLAWDDAIREAVARLGAKQGIRVEIPVALFHKHEDRDSKMSVQGRRAMLVPCPTGAVTVVALGPSELADGKGRIRQCDPSEWRGEVLAEFDLP